VKTEVRHQGRLDWSLVTISALEIGSASSWIILVSEQKSDSQGRTVDGTTDPEETRLIAELTDCHQVSRAKQEALSNPGSSVLAGGSEHKELVKAAEIGKAKEETVRVKLKAHRRAKLRKRDFNDLIGLRAAVNDLEVEIHEIFLDNDSYREHLTHSPEATTVYQQHFGRLLTIREKIARLKLVMDSVDGNPDIS
jgi:hypothetical protein